MLDFTSALYLGLRHESASLRGWRRLTTGVPAALAPPPEAVPLARRLAGLQGAMRATLAPSTLHVFWDLFTLTSPGDGVVYVDAGSYPIARWGVERSACRGARSRSFAHYDAEALTRALRQDAPHARPPVVLADGICVDCGRAAPVARYRDALRPHGGLLVLDDTQAMGILGSGRRPAAPYGTGGGGSLRWHGVRGPDIAIAGSLAKGFGVPIAALAGDSALVERFEAGSETRVHCSPPSTAALRALEHALDVNDERGDLLRRRLASAVVRFRRRLAAAGLTSRGGLFPVQTVELRGADPVDVHRRLLRSGVRTALRRGTHEGRLTFVLTAAHLADEIDAAVAALVAVLGRAARRPAMEVAR